MFNTTTSKAIVILLSVCLIVVIGLFLYSEYSTDRHSSAVKEDAVASQTNTNSSNAKSNDKNTVNVAVDETDEQEEKSLPIPARQLKKLLGDTPEDNTLEQKIEAANQAIAELEQTLPSELSNVTSENSLNTTSNEQSDDIQKRLQHIRNHLEKNE